MEGTATSTRTGRWWGLIGLITLAGSVPRIWSWAESLAWDELYLYSWVHDRGFGQMLDVVRAKEKTPPLGFVVAWLADRVAGVPQGVRIPSLIAGIAIVPMTALLGRRAFGPTAGAVAALFAAASPMLVFYSVEARSYSLTAAFALASTLLLIHTLDTGSRRSAVGYAVAAGAALMSHYTAVGVLAAQAVLAFVLWPERRRPVAAAQAGPALALLVWLPGMLDQLRISSDELARLASVAPLTFGHVLGIVGRNLFGHPLAPNDQVPGTLGLALVATGASISALFMAFRAVGWLRAATRPRPHRETLLTIAIAMSGPLVAVAVSAQPHQSMLVPRNLMVSLPAAVALFAALCTRARVPANWIATALVLAGLSIGTWTTVTTSARPDARGAALAVAKAWRPGDGIVELCCLTGAEGPLGTAVSINMPANLAGKVSVLSRTGDAPYLEALRTGRPLFVIGYYLAPSKRDRLSRRKDAWRWLMPMFLAPPADFNRAFSAKVIFRRKGMLDTVVLEYTRKAG